jgi:transcriptional regulator with XRE-family HTH domain
VDLNEMLGIDPDNPADQHARLLVREDGALLDALVELRKRADISQTEVAARMGVSPSAVSRIESGDRDPHLSTLRRYALAIGAVVQHDVRPFSSAVVAERTPFAVSFPAWQSIEETVAASPSRRVTA